MDKVCPRCQRTYQGADMFCPEDGTALVANDVAPDVANNAAAAATIIAANASTEDTLLGRLVDSRYELTQLLGVGGMGRVYLAQHRFLKRPVAVKVLHRGRVNDPSELVRFNRTAVHAGTIANDHVAGIYDFGETEDGLVYLAMEYVPGDTLTRMVKKEGPFEPARVAELTRQIANGLDAAHAQGIIHRDLKPDNIMVMRDRHGHELVKIVDFGIAKAISTESKGVTQLGAVVGTLLYMSPEQLAGGTLDRRSDVYSLGLVVFHMLAGALPFTGSTPEEVIYARFDPAGPRPLAAVRPTMYWPPRLQQTLDRALARDASARFDTAGAFAAALGSAVTDTAELRAVEPARGEKSARGKVAREAAPPARRPAPSPKPAASASASRGRGMSARTSRVAALSTAALLVIAAGATAVKYWPDGTDQERRSSDGRPVDTAHGAVPVAQRDSPTPASNPTNRPPVVVGDPNAPLTRPETVAPRPDPGAAQRAALQELERHRRNLHPDSTVSSSAARAAIGRLDALLPRLITRNDSLFAMLYQSHAYFHLGNLDAQCSVLRRIRERSGGTRLEGVIDQYFGYGKCP